MKPLHIALGLAALASAASASAQQVGDWVLAPWNDDPWLYPGVVGARSGVYVTVNFDDGTSQTRHVTELRDFDWREGTPVQCQWTDGYFYNATVLFMGSNGYTIRVRYDDDGVVQDTNTGHCRTRGRY
ncbi:MAG: hypothetical protein KDE15_12730 [Erythrobacter sp.]|nr:hypothetical protein [Erythrobacter sp.]